MQKYFSMNPATISKTTISSKKTSVPVRFCTFVFLLFVVVVVVVVVVVIVIVVDVVVDVVVVVVSRLFR